MSKRGFAARPVVKLEPRLPKVAMYSLWRNDEERNIQWRMRHLVDKSYQNMRWVWVCGDSDDATADVLSEYAMSRPDLAITVVEHFTGIDGNDHRSRLHRLSASCSEALDQVSPTDDYVLIHESDLVSPEDLVEQLLATGKSHIAAATWLDMPNGRAFYDIWGFWKDGERFANWAPYHSAWTPDKLMEVDSFGSCWMVPAWPFVGESGIRVETDAAREMCGKLKLRDPGAKFWLAPWIEVMQPRELWEPHNLTEAAIALTEWDQ